jgi:DNA (cytosine-5)-methyltransferase 1
MDLNLLELFAGIGGFSIAAELTKKIKTVGFVELEKFPQLVLKKNYPDTPIFSDIRDFNKESYETHYEGNAPKIDIITGGFPCQPFSVAGNQQGTSAHNYLWPEMFRVIKEFKPSWVIGENVAGITSMVKSEGEIKMESETSSLFQEDSQIYTEEYQFVLESICQDFERIGYSVQPLIIPACGVGATHRRDRVWIIANAYKDGS